MKTQNSKRKKIIIAAAAVICIVAAGAGTYMASVAKANEEKEDVPQYQTVVLGKQDVTREIGLSGTMSSAHSENVSSTLEGVKIKEICVKVGDHVKPEDVLFRLDTTDIESKLKAAKSALASEKEKNAAEITSSQRNFTDAQTTLNLETQRNGQSVTDATNDYQASVDAKNNAENEYQQVVSDLDAKEKEIKKAKEKLDEAKETEKTKKAALKDVESEENEDKKAKAKSEYDDAVKKKSDCEAKVSALEGEAAALNEAKAVKEAAAKEAGASVSVAEDTLKKAKEQNEDSVRNNNKTVADQKDSLEAAKRNASAESSAAQEVENYEKALENCTVKAASNGVVTSISVKVGDTYTNGIMATIQDEKNYIVTAMVGQYDISDIKMDMKAIIKTETTGDEEMEGTVTFVSPVPESSAAPEGGNSGSGSSSSSNYEVQITVKNPSERLRIGMTAKVKLIQDEVKNVFAVPYDCITEKEDKTYSIQVLKDGTPEEIVVKKGLETDYYTEISGEGLEEGMEVIIPEMMDATGDMGGGNMSMSIY